jgi:hypothetical protein
VQSRKNRKASEARTYLGSFLVLLEDIHAGSAHLFLYALEECCLLKDWLVDCTVLLFEVFLGLT